MTTKTDPIAVCEQFLRENLLHPDSWINSPLEIRKALDAVLKELRTLRAENGRLLKILDEASCKISLMQKVIDEDGYIIARLKEEKE